ncbi:hypothetical protein A3860_17430 [Niastella vici]|uniref:Uncharacterized protein n=1 Tax=Niastella vici TaxID=1703345 RepID=A0A1V9G4Q6_9BACT|nr:hypothetical protein [Niastella vici]OQP65446.1 hypothetical protein A3860_17430 [Niastella vici]
MDNIQVLKFDLEEIKKSASGIFDNPIYDALLHIAYSMFGKSSVSVDKEQFLSLIRSICILALAQINAKPTSSAILYLLNMLFRNRQISVTSL